jgi:signal transduction histidine kinase
MRADERERLQRLLEEMGRLNDRLNVQHRAAVQELARTRHRLSTQQDLVDLVARDHPDSPQAAVALAQFLLTHGELDAHERELARRIVSSGDEIAELVRELIEALRGST